TNSVAGERRQRDRHAKKSARGRKIFRGGGRATRRSELRSFHRGSRPGPAPVIRGAGKNQAETRHHIPHTIYGIIFSLPRTKIDRFSRSRSHRCIPPFSARIRKNPATSRLPLGSPRDIVR